MSDSKPPENKKQEPPFDVVAAFATFLNDIRERLNEYPTEHRDAIRRDLITNLQSVLKNVGANPLRRTPVFEVPHESGVGVRVVPQNEFVKGNDKTESIPTTSPTAKVLVD